jgi:hypothetical protein
MSEGKQRRLVEQIQDPEFLEGIGDKAIEELRSMRDQCREAENELSFERRLCQGRIDILSAELDRREGGTESSLLARLPEILAEERGGRPSDTPLPSRAPDFSIPRNADIPRRRVEEIVGEQMLTRLPQLPPEDIRHILTNLAEHERSVSTRRKAVQDVMDSVQAEIVRRYTSGEADPAKVLG